LILRPLLSSTVDCCTTPEKKTSKVMLLLNHFATLLKTLYQNLDYIILHQNLDKAQKKIKIKSELSSLVLI